MNMIDYKAEVLKWNEEQIKKGLIDMKISLNSEYKDLKEEDIYKELYHMIQAEKEGRFTKVTEL
jgi:hypothetical protein